MKRFTLMAAIIVALTTVAHAQFDFSWDRPTLLDHTETVKTIDTAMQDTKDAEGAHLVVFYDGEDEQHISQVATMLDQMRSTWSWNDPALVNLRTCRHNPVSNKIMQTIEAEREVPDQVFATVLHREGEKQQVKRRDVIPLPPSVHTLAAWYVTQLQGSTPWEEPANAGGWSQPAQQSSWSRSVERSKSVQRGSGWSSAANSWAVQANVGCANGQCSTARRRGLLGRR